ncbi:MAG: ABC transporter ATP-binding protein [Myxococcota bacterium]
MSTDRDPPVLEVEGLSIAVHGDHGPTPVVQDISFAVEHGRTLGLLGASGSGKTLISWAILRLLDRNVTVAVRGLRWEGRDLLAMSPRELDTVRGRGIGLVQQDPNAALDPYLTVGTQLCEGLRLHRGLSARAAEVRAVSVLRELGVAAPVARMRSYPHELSGGTRQRLALAMALLMEPALLWADEPTTALDPTTQAQVLAALRARQRATGMAIVFVTHDLGVLAQVADDVVVLHEGRVVEAAPVEQLFRAPQHPFTRQLLACLPQRTEATDV